MNLRQLEIFTTVISSGSFTKAANKLHMAQPAVSIAIRKLEQILDMQLISRADIIKPTAEGEVLLQHAEQLLADMLLTRQAMEDLQQLKTGTVRLSTTPILGDYLLPDKIQHFKEHYPDINFQITDQGTIANHEPLNKQQCDLGVVDMENIPTTMTATPLQEQEIVVCLPQNHPLTTQTHITMDTLLQQPLALYSEGHILREIIDQACGKQQQTTIILETDFTGILLHTIKNNNGVGICLKAINLSLIHI